MAPVLFTSAAPASGTDPGLGWWTGMAATYTTTRGTPLVATFKAYQVRPTLTLTCDVANIFNEPQRLYQGVRGRTQDIMYNFVTVTFGVSGRY